MSKSSSSSKGQKSQEVLSHRLPGRIDGKQPERPQCTRSPTATENQGRMACFLLPLLCPHPRQPAQEPKVNEGSLPRATRDHLLRKKGTSESHLKVRDPKQATSRGPLHSVSQGTHTGVSSAQEDMSLQSGTGPHLADHPGWNLGKHKSLPSHRWNEMTPITQSCDTWICEQSLMY